MKKKKNSLSVFMAGNSKKKMKQVQYMGNVYEVPDEAEYIATDRNYSIFWYSLQPYIRDDWFGVWNEGKGNECGYVGTTFVDKWQNSLKKFNHNQ